jgi:ribonuclease D
MDAESQDVAWVDDPVQAQALAQRLRGLNALAVDTEFVRQQTYRARLGLIQIHDGTRPVLVDPLPAGVLDALRAVFTAPIPLIIHSASEDLEVLGHAFGQVPTQLFDTQIAEVMLGADPPPGYQKLVQRELGIELPKQAQRTDWLKRPLDAEQLRYAAEDVAWLPTIADRQRDALTRLGRWDWFAEECARLCERVRAAQDPNPHLKIKSCERFTPLQQQRLWRLLRWRDAEAMARDRPKNWILDQGVAVRAALLDRLDRASLEAAAQIDGRPSPRVAAKLESLLKQEASAEELAIPLARPLEESEKQRAQGLRAHVETVAAELGIAPEFLCNRRGLEHWARHDQLPEDLKGWRQRLLGL